LTFWHTPYDDVATEIRHTGDPPWQAGFSCLRIVLLVSRIMRKINFALELFLLVCGILPLGVLSAYYLFTTGKVPSALIFGLLAVLAGCVIAGIQERFESDRVLSLKEMKLRCSVTASRAAIIWIAVEAIARVGIWAGFAWLKWVEIAAAGTFFLVFALACLEDRYLRITLQAMDEMQEYVDRRIQERDKESEDILHE